MDQQPAPPAHRAAGAPASSHGGVVGPAVERRGLVALCFAAALIALSPIFAVLAARWSGLDPLVTASYRTGVAAPLLLLAVAWRRFRGRPASTGSSPSSGSSSSNGRMASKAYGTLLLAGVFFALDLGSWHVSMSIIAAGIATFLSNLSALFVPLLAWLLFKERPTVRFAIGTAIAIAGTGLLLLPPDHTVMRTLPSTGASYALGNVLGVATAVFYAGYQLSVKHARSKVDTLTVMTTTTMTSATLLFVICVVADFDLIPKEPRAWWPLVGMALCSQIAGQGLIAWSLGRVRASLAAVVLLLQPTLATVLGAVVLHQRMSVSQTLALLPVVFGLAIATTRTPRRGAPMGM